MNYEKRNIGAVAAILLFSAIFFSSGIYISSAEVSPSPPQTFVGNIKFKNVNGLFDAPSGTKIEAIIDGVTQGSTSVIIAGNYEIGVSGTYEDDGKTIRFRSQDHYAEQTAVFSANMQSPESLDLIIELTDEPEDDMQVVIYLSILIVVLALISIIIALKLKRKKRGNESS